MNPDYQVYLNWFAKQVEKHLVHSDKHLLAIRGRIDLGVCILFIMSVYWDVSGYYSFWIGLFYL